MRINLSTITNLSRRAKIVALIGVFIATGSAAAAISSFTPSTAEEMSPTDVKVVEHEARLDKNEADIAQTNDRVTQVEQETDENTAAIGATQERVTVVEKKTETVVQQVAGQQSIASAPAPAPAPAPEPVKTINPRLVTAVVSTEKYDSKGGFAGWNCTYTLETGRVIEHNQGYACHAVGTEIAEEIALMWRVW